MSDVHVKERAAATDLCEVLPGALYLCGHLATAADLEALGITALIDLSGTPAPWVRGEPDHFVYVHWPIRDAPYEPDAASLRACAVFGATLLATRRVAVRCGAGENRSALVAAAILAERDGVSGAAAIENVRAAQPAALSNPHFVALLERLYPAR